jgi:hypothetical protein
VRLRAQAILTASFKGWGGDCTGTGFCFLTMDSNKDVTADFAALGLVAPAAQSTDQGAPTLRSTLGVRSGRGDVALNGSSVLTAREGESRVALHPQPGDNLVEARLLEGAMSGTWQFDLVGGGRLETRALRVVSGELVAVGPDSITFRLSGRAGERVAFTWTAARAER